MAQRAQRLKCPLRMSATAWCVISQTASVVCRFNRDAASFHLIYSSASFTNRKFLSSYSRLPSAGRSNTEYLADSPLNLRIATDSRCARCQAKTTSSRLLMEVPRTLPRPHTQEQVRRNRHTNKMTLMGLHSSSSSSLTISPVRRWDTTSSNRDSTVNNHTVSSSTGIMARHKDNINRDRISKALTTSSRAIRRKATSETTTEAWAVQPLAFSVVWLRPVLAAAAWTCFFNGATIK